MEWTLALFGLAGVAHVASVVYRTHRESRWARGALWISNAVFVVTAEVNLWLRAPRWLTVALAVGVLVGATAGVGGWWRRRRGRHRGRRRDAG